MRVLVACENSQTVTKAFRAKGHKAYSCDILPTSGREDWHIQGDALEVINNGWDLIIAHPPCTYLSCVGNRYFNEERYGEKARERKRLREEGFKFFMEFENANCKKVCIENPMGYVNTHWRKPDQVIHPYYFGDPYLKRTCLWLKGLPKLTWTCNSLYGERTKKPEPVYIRDNGTPVHWCESLITLPGEERQKVRSKTFPRIAQAMANQWG